MHVTFSTVQGVENTVN